jgi:hypothetical protein
MMPILLIDALGRGAPPNSSLFSQKIPIAASVAGADLAINLTGLLPFTMGTFRRSKELHGPVAYRPERKDGQVFHVILVYSPWHFLPLPGQHAIGTADIAGAKIEQRLGLD